MNNIFLNLILPLIIIAIFLGVLTYLCFLKPKKKEQNCCYNAHITDLGISEKEALAFLKKNNIEPQFLRLTVKNFPYFNEEMN
ncbi:MAG: hypothetical protein ACI37Z_03605 [Candidatus Gastranaerophilaceae bacterium]